MKFEKTPPTWSAEGTEPPSSLKSSGFSAGYKPPAAYFNWFWTTVSECLKELQEAAGKITMTDIAINSGGKGGMVCYSAIEQIDGVTASLTSSELVTIMPNNSAVMFTHNSSNTITITDMPGNYGIAVLFRGYSSKYCNGLFYDTDGRMFRYKYNESSTTMNGWYEVALATYVVSKAGDTMSGDLNISKSYPATFWNSTDASRDAFIQVNSVGDSQFGNRAAGDSNNKSLLVLKKESETIEELLKIYTTINGVNKGYRIYGEHNKPTASELGISTQDGTVTSGNADYAEVGEWADGNTADENRIGYFVAVDPSTAGTTMVKATSTMDVRGVTVSAPAFSGNCSADKFDAETDALLKQYDFVACMGLVSVIDNGTCTINGRCMPADDGTAVPSSNNMGYQVIDRIDSTHILIAVEPGADMIQRIKTDMDNKTAVSVYTATIGTTWTENEDTGVKSQSVAIPGVLAKHTAKVDHAYTGDGTSDGYAAFVEAENQYLNYITNGYAETYDGGIAFHIFGDAPTVEIPIVVEVA